MRTLLHEIFIYVIAYYLKIKITMRVIFIHCQNIFCG